VQPLWAHAGSGGPPRRDAAGREILGHRYCLRLNATPAGVATRHGTHSHLSRADRAPQWLSQLGERSLMPRTRRQVPQPRNSASIYERPGFTLRQIQPAATSHTSPKALAHGFAIPTPSWGRSRRTRHSPVRGQCWALTSRPRADGNRRGAWRFADYFTIPSTPGCCGGADPALSL
jgi:hypothetical protein